MLQTRARRWAATGLVSLNMTAACGSSGTDANPAGAGGAGGSAGASAGADAGGMSGTGGTAAGGGQGGGGDAGTSGAAGSSGAGGSMAEASVETGSTGAGGAGEVLGDSGASGTTRDASSEVAAVADGSNASRDAADPRDATRASDGQASSAPPAIGAYGTRASLLASTSEMAVAEAAGKIYVIGGYPSSPANSVTTVAVYTPATDTWSTTTPYPFALHHPVVIGVAGKLYSLGGQTPSADSARSFELDPATGMWRELTAMPTARGAGAAAAIGDKIYVVGGRPPAANQLEVYDISDNAWTTLPPLPQAFPQRNHLSAVAIGDKVYVTGGRYNGGSFSSPRTSSLDVFDPATGTWSLGAPMLDPPRGGHNGVAAYGCYHIWGGEGSGTGFANDVFPQHDVYNPRTNMWTRLAPLPTPVHGVTGAAFLDGLIYMPGGGTMSGGSSGSRIFQIFRPDPATGCE